MKNCMENLQLTPLPTPRFKKQNALNVYFHFGCAGGSTMKWDNLLFSALQQKFSLSLSCEEPTFVQNQPWNSATLSSFRFHTNPLISPGMISMKQSSFKVIGVSKLQRWFLTFLSTFRSNTNPSFILMIKKPVVQCGHTTGLIWLLTHLLVWWLPPP